MESEVSSSDARARSVETGGARSAPERVVVLGLARQGIAVTRFFCRSGADVTVSDLAAEGGLRSEIAELGDLPVRFVLGTHPETLLDECALLVLSGGVPPQIPIVQEAVARGIPLSNDSLLTMQQVRARGLGPVVAVTGSSGKTTTTTLVGLMLGGEDRAVHVGGNIGVPLLDKLGSVGPNEPIVLELSSFQLELYDESLAKTSLHDVGPSIAGITNITPNHLDRHPSMAAYVSAKLNLIATMPRGAQLILNLDDPVTGALASGEVGAAGASPLAKWGLQRDLARANRQIAERGLAIVPYSLHARLEKGAWLDGDTLLVDGAVICQRAELRIRGEHNVSNMLAAAALSRRAGARIESIRRVATTFQGVPHRLETVAVIDGVTWINDSIATSPERAVAALRSFADPQRDIILLAGGKDKRLPWDVFATAVLERVDWLIGFGDSGAMIVNHVKEQARFDQTQPPGCAVVQRLDEAVALAARTATSGAIVLLSPGGTSFDAYRDFEERGAHFRRLVTELATDRDEADGGGRQSERDARGT